jgi:arginase
MAEVQAAIGLTIRAAEILRDGPAATAARIREHLDRQDLDGYWLHLDVDVLDAAVMPAVDSPDPGGLDAARLTGLLTALAPGAAGANVAVFDPDLDPDGRYARLLVDIATEGLGRLGADRPAATASGT